MEKVEILVIGAGCIGLAIGRELTETFDDVVIVEKESSYGRHTSSRNSEVIHSGIYYPAQSLKAHLCVEGRQLIYDYLKEKKIKHRQCGKLVIAALDSEIPALNDLRDNGRANGVEGLEMLKQNECRKLAPEVIAAQALLVPCTGIMDTHSFMRALKMDIEAQDGFVLFDEEVISLEKRDEGYLVDFASGEQFMADKVINCAGLQSEKIAKMAGIDTQKAGIALHWCKAEYYKTSQKFSFDKLIYPLPDPTGMYLGIHLTLNLAGEVRFGPSAFYVDDLDYGMDESRRGDFEKAVGKYLHFDPQKIHPDDTGIRPKLQGPGERFRDFYIKEEIEHNLPGFYNLTGIESPGLTSALAIARYVKDLITLKAN